MSGKRITAEEATLTLRHPPYMYFHLSLINVQTVRNIRSSNSSPELDDITLVSYLNSALSGYLGLLGAAIPIDVSKIEGQEAWVRVPYEDGGAVVASISQWSGMKNGIGLQLRIRGSGSWLGGLMKQDDKLWTLER